MPYVPEPNLTIEVGLAELAPLVGGQFDRLTGTLTMPKPLALLRNPLPLKLGDHDLGMWEVDAIDSYTDRHQNGTFGGGYLLTLRKVN